MYASAEAVDTVVDALREALAALRVEYEDVTARLEPLKARREQLRQDVRSVEFTLQRFAARQANMTKGPMP